MILIYVNQKYNSHNLYYNIQSKNCWDNFIPEDYKYINNKDDTNKKYEVVKECEYFYYEEGTAPNIKKYCTSECKNSIINKYFIHSQKKCENSCSEFNKHYYDPTNNECLDSCKNLPNYEFAYQVEVSTPVQECREKCDLLTDASGNHKYYDYDSNICINQCGQNDANKKVRAKDGQICYISCDQIPGGQYIYESDNICYQNYADIPSNCDYYYIKPNGIKQCTTQAECINENIFLYFVDKECRENCDGYYKYEDSVIISGTTKKYYKCFESKEKALSDNNCIYYNIKSKLCWRNFPEGYFINQEETLHTINRYEVVEECPYFYYEISVPTDTSKKCGRCTDLNKCEVTGNTFKYFTKGQKKCEDSCTKFNPIKYYYNSETYECLDTCEEFPGKEFANQISSSYPIQPCISECGIDLYYDYDSKICFGKCGNGNPNYLYHTKDSTSYDPKDYKCYPSCKDIKIDNYLYQYKDTVDPNIKICSKTIPSTGCPYYYKNIDGTLECLPDANACLEMRYNYLLGQECKSECNDFYKLEDDTTTGLIKCFETKDKCLNTGTGGGGAKYFNIKLKKCWINFPQQYFVKDYTATTQIEVLEECEYYYYQDNVSGEDIYYCIDECKIKDLYFNSGNKKCESSCTVFSMHYYIENKNECLETCEGSTGIEFANYIDLNINSASNQTPCKSKCNMNTILPLTDNYIYFYYGTKTCRTSCGGSNKFIITYDTSVIDQDIICYSSCSEIPGGIYRYEYVDESSATPEYKCFKEEEIAEGQPSASKCPFYYSQGDGSMKCVLNLNECKTEGFNYYLERECLQNCDNYYKFMDEGIDTIECFRDLQNAFNSPKNIKFYERATKRVWKDMPINYFVLYDIDTDRHEIIETCENYYYTKAPNNWNYCRDNCTTFGLFFDKENSNKKCESSCTDFTPSKLYYDANTLECLTTCIGNTPYSYPIDTNNPTRPCVSKCQNYFITKTDNQGIEHKECVDTCPVTDGSTTYDIIDKKTKECVTSCLPTQIEVDSKCYPKCDYDNGEIYINIDNYECETSCPPGLRNMILLTTNSDGIEIYLCKSFCDENKFRLEDKCLEKCPEGFNYIGHGNICKENCRTDPNGEYYYRVNDHVAHDHLIYKCINNCDEASITNEITSTIITFPYHSKKNNECHRNKCPTYAPHFISSQPYDCLDKCPDEFPFYDKANSNYECVENTICTGSDKFYFDGECFNDCGSRMYYDTKKICLDKCRDKEIKQLEGTRYICKEACEHYIYFESELDDQSCVIDCPEDKRFIGKNDICKKSCDEEDGINYYKYPVVDTTLSYIIYKCVSGCEGEHDFNLKLINNGPECYHTCPSNYPYLSSEENLCYDDCLKSSQNPFTLISGTGAGITKICTTIIECESSGKKYYGENKICLSNCNELGERYLMNYDNTCVLKCDLTSTYKFQLVNQCTDKCLAPNIRYSTNDYICKDKCGINENIVTDNNECINTCDKFINAINSDEYKCIDSCASIDKFYYETETKKKCLHECYRNDKIIEGLNRCIDTCDNLYINDNRYYLCEDCGEKENPETLTNYIYDKCVTTCPDEKPYIDIELNKCIDICPIDKRYFVKNYIHSGEAEIKTKNVCLNDCPIEYPYYTITKDSLNRDIYECSNICNGYFVPNEDSNIIGKLCVNSCTKDDTQYKYKIEEENDNILLKKCYERCPTEYKYHFDISMSINTDNTCYKQCLESAPYHKKGETICLKLSELIGGFLLLEEKEWTNDISACPSSYKYKSKVTNGVIICLNECISNDLGGIYLTPYKTCVTTCSTSDPLSLAYQKNLMNDELNQKCVCRNLYYIFDSNFEIVCYEYSLTSCKNTIDGHKLPLYGTKQCLKTCIDDRILSPSEDICYDKNYSCPVNTEKITKSDGQKKCECKYKYYYQDTAKTIKICLGENDICPEPHIYYNTETKECASECSSEYLIFKNFCVKDCPKGTTKSGNTCDCGDRFWYQISEGNFECLIGACLDDFPLYSAENKECLKSCKNTYFPYLFENKCYRDCYPNTGIPNLETINIDSPLAEHECYCPSPWYYDNNHIVHCPTFGSIYKCRDYAGINKEYMIEETKECVNICPTNYPYHFNYECFISCEFANEKYRYNIEQVESSYECKCPNLWYIKHVLPEDADKIFCHEKELNECPRTNPDPSTSYLILSTKQCVFNYQECPEKSYKFNGICYDKCPEFTLESKDTNLASGYENICLCNKNNYLWLDYEKYGNTYYKCGLTECPEEFIDGENSFPRKNLLENQNKCVESCRDNGPADNEYLYSFRNKCAQQCPSLTELHYDQCDFIDLTDKSRIDTLEKMKEAANIQAKELYERSEQLSGFLMNDFDASLQIYTLNKLDSHKNLSMKSNLTYIELGNCLDKIYKDNNLTDDDKIIVTKYDLLSRNHKTNDIDSEDNTGNDIDNKFLINQVEYEFYLLNNMKKIEGSICSPYEILISYPICFNKNKFNNYEDGINNNNYLKQFKIGKILHDKNSEIDTFNKDNKVYKDLCTGVDINGKDLVLEDRYYYLYPNNISLCESNCTMKNTDFELERINCMCTYKEIFDFNRIDEDTNDILSDPNFEKPKQSNANGNIIKCISKINKQDGIIKNEAFYFCIISGGIEISMVLVTVFKGIVELAKFMNSMMNTNRAKPDINNLTGNKDINNANSSNRIINNPPKKNEENSKETDSNKGNILIRKSIKISIPNNIKNSFNDISEKSMINNDNNGNYGFPMKSNLYKNRNLSNKFLSNDKKQTTMMNTRNNLVNRNSKYNNIKAEFIPPKYNFKYFKPNDKGVIKRIYRSQIPFKIEPDTKILLEGKYDISYNENYLNGPYYEDQNIIEIIDDTNINNSIKIIKDNNIDNNKDDKNTMKILKNSKNNDINNGIVIYNENKAETKRKLSLRNKEKKITNSQSEKNFINIKKINPITYKINLEDYKEVEVKNIDNTTSIYNLMKREHTYLRATYQKYISKNHPNILALFLAEILDKIYFIKIFIFLKKFEMLSVQLSLYIFYHVLLLCLLCGFFTISTIKKIWEEPNFPTMNFYLLYGFLGNIIVWIIYKIFILLLDNQDRIRNMLYMNNIKENSKDESKDISSKNDDLNQKCEETMKCIKIQTVVFYIIILIFTGFCSIYLVSFFAVYTGTKKLVLKTYYISIIEIILIKFVYGVSLASLRIAADNNELKTLYNFVYYLDKYLS